MPTAPRAATLPLVVAGRNVGAAILIRDVTDAAAHENEPATRCAC